MNRHTIEIFLKHIYMRAKGHFPQGGHNILTLWDNVKKEIIDEIICSELFLSELEKYKGQH